MPDAQNDESKYYSPRGIGEIPGGHERNEEREEIGRLATRRLRAGGCARSHWLLAAAARCRNK